MHKIILIDDDFCRLDFCKKTSTIATMTKDNNKLYWLIGGGVGLLVLVIICIVAFAGGKKQTPAEPEVVAEQPTKKKRISAPQNVTDIQERPVVSLHPFSKDGGRFVSIVVSDMRKQADSAEYEIVYNVVGASAVDAKGKAISDFDAEAEGGLQAFIGELDLAKLPTSTENRFGTCSAGGACINNNVDYGTLTLNFDAAEKFGVNTTWTYFETGKAASQSHDGQFTITADELASAQDYLIMQQIGLPAGLTDEVVMLPDGGRDNGTWPVAYQLSFTKAPKLTTAQVEFSAAGGTHVAVYDGKSWTSYELGEKVPAGDGYIYVLTTSSAGTTAQAQ